ncbi:low molecular weight protein-tyrosine-phosphatase [Paenibacillus sp. GD4]|jgi:protein-tyrosine phosphatase|uniref:low molecular weight protein-tyrosine-phosphatase n=1 Tax=Paenibacillus sp. GD4 TaxID=3068890 RepID=UPI002796D4F8|nr:low molecular weight protein-tyrosine-phosphatase [Paenibacillus sp. GD4]MDQ1910480.1 low molecular weight protein-tyrosine-phosphatase [Paenibacillus sp. GD4]
MINILFVCLGNICRSPMAEAVFRKKVREAGLEDRIRIDSAGTGSWHIGKPPHEGTRRILKQYGIDTTGMKARQVGAEDFRDYQYIIAMDSSNVRNLEAIAPSGHGAEVRKLLDWAPNAGVTDVPDPYYTGNFEEVYKLVDEACDTLLSYIREREKV